MAEKESSSDTEDERDYYEFLYGNAKRKADNGDYQAAEKTLRQIRKKAIRGKVIEYMQPGGEGHYNVVRLLSSVYEQQNRLEDAMQLCETSIGAIGGVSGEDGTLCTTLKGDFARLVGLQRGAGGTRCQETDDTAGDDELEPRNEQIPHVRRSIENCAIDLGEGGTHSTLTYTETISAGDATYTENVALPFGYSSYPALHLQVESAALDSRPTLAQETTAIEDTSHGVETEVHNLPPGPVESGGQATKTKLFKKSSRDRDNVAILPRHILAPEEEDSIEEWIKHICNWNVDPEEVDARKSPSLRELTPPSTPDPQVAQADTLGGLMPFSARRSRRTTSTKNFRTMASPDGLCWPPYEEQNSFNVVVVGDAASGKTELIHQLLRTSTFEDGYSTTTLGDSLYTGVLDDGKHYPSIRILEVNDSNIDFIWPTIDRIKRDRDYYLGSTIAGSFIATAEVFLLCFSTRNSPSLDNITSKWLPGLRILASSSQKVQQRCVLVGCHAYADDVKPAWSNATLSRLLVIDRLRADKIIDSLGLPFVETSSKSGDGITELRKRLGGYLPGPWSTNSIESPQVLFAGDGLCGKTYLVNSMMGRPFNPIEGTTWVDSYKAPHRATDGKHYILNLIDHGGLPQQDGSRKRHYRKAEIVVLCYDVSNRRTLKHVAKKWLPKIRSRANGKTIIFVGCKKEMRLSCGTCVSYEEIDSFREAHDELRGAIYLETSVYTGDGIFQLKEAIVSVTKTLASKETPSSDSLAHEPSSLIQTSFRDFFRRN